MPASPPLHAVRPTPEQVVLMASDRAAAAAAMSVANPASWSAAGHDGVAVWGRYVATSAEPYEVAIDLTGPAFRCGCPSRKVPCKHALGLLLLHAHHHVAPATRLPFADQWMHRRDGHPASRPAAPTPDVGAGGDHGVEVERRVAVPGPRVRGGEVDVQRDRRRLDRVDRMRSGARELDRWVGDRIRSGLADSELADPAGWDRVAARLVDAQCGGLAGRVRRVAALVGSHARWHDDVLEELAILHGLARATDRLGALPELLADGVGAAAGLSAASADVLASVPTTARWLVAGESRAREGMITVQRTWLRARSAAGEGASRATWAVVFAFGAVGREVTSLAPTGSELHADVHWYPGTLPLRGLVGHVHSRVEIGDAPELVSLDAALDAAGWCLAREPWLERAPFCARVTPMPVGDGRWRLADGHGSVAIAPGFWRLAELIALSGGRPITVVGELSADGVLPLTAWADDEMLVAS